MTSDDPLEIINSMEEDHPFVNNIERKNSEVLRDDWRILLKLNQVINPAIG